MQKIVINACHGGFDLSDAGMKKYSDIKGITLYAISDAKWLSLVTYWKVPEEERVQELPGEWMDHSIEDRRAYNEKYTSQVFRIKDILRNDSALVQVVEELGDAANGEYAKLKVVEVPDDVQWTVEEYDGWESVEEVHRKWE